MLDKVIFLLGEYIARQQITYDALMELRPYSFMKVGENTTVEILMETVKNYGHINDIGVWNKYGQWKYYLHGRGCRLTNLISGEIIEWDAPNITDFKPEWFLNWVNWVRKVNENYHDLSDSIVYKILHQLEGDSIIERISPHSNPKLRFLGQT